MRTSSHPADVRNRSTELYQEVEAGGRVYAVTAKTADDDRVEVDLVSADPDGQVISRLSGTLPVEDLSVAATVVGRLLAGVGLLCNGDWDRASQVLHSESRLEQIRRKHPNAGKKWESADDERLVTDFKAGAGISELANRLGRQYGAIRSRLVKHGLIDAFEPSAPNDTADAEATADTDE